MSDAKTPILLVMGRDRETACPLFDGTKEVGVIDAGDIRESRRYAIAIIDALNSMALERAVTDILEREDRVRIDE